MVNEIVKIHKESFPDYVISKHFSHSFLRNFYLKCLTDGWIFTERDNDDIIGYATCVYSLKKFESEFKNEYKFLGGLELIKILLLRKATLKEIKNYITADSYYPDESGHLGAIALNMDYRGTFRGRKAVKDLTDRVHEHLRIRGYKYCTGSTNVKNIATQLFLLRVGYEFVWESKGVKYYKYEL